MKTRELITAIKEGCGYDEIFGEIWSTLVAQKISEIRESIIHNLYDIDEKYDDRAGAFRSRWDFGGRSRSQKVSDERADLHPNIKQKAPDIRIYHDVKYADKDKAKAEGMRFDGEKKKWYHTTKYKSDNSSFPKL